MKPETRLSNSIGSLTPQLEGPYCSTAHSVREDFDKQNQKGEKERGQDE